MNNNKKTNEQTEPETWKQNRLTADRGKGGEREWWKEGEEISPRTCMNDSWTGTTVLGWTVGAGAGAGWRRSKGEKLGQLE